MSWDTSLHARRNSPDFTVFECIAVTQRLLDVKAIFDISKPKNDFKI